MIKRTIEVSSLERTHIRRKQKHLVFEREGSEKGRVPLEDIGVLVIDSPSATCSTRALASVVENGAVVVFCGNDRHPAGLLWPMQGNQLHTQKLKAQLAAKEPQKKQFWKQIVQAKLIAQANQLQDDEPAKEKIKYLAKGVRSGDPDNREAQGSRLYWPVVFGDPEFKRSRNGPTPNNLLNYGYMALRAAMARAVCAAGLHPAIGLHHHHRNNPFCLVDDLMEPYRPFVDEVVRELWLEDIEIVDKESKATLLSILSKPIVLDDESGPLLVAMQKTASSLCNCFEGTEKKLKLPEP